MESTPTQNIAKSTGFSFKCSMQASQWGNARPPRCFARGSGWQQLPRAVTSFISRLTTHINIYAPQIKPDPSAVCSGTFIIKLKREEGQRQQEDTHMSIRRQTALPQPNHTVTRYRNSKGTHCFASTVWLMSKVLIKHRVQWNLHNFLQGYQQITRPTSPKFYIKINPFKIIRISCSKQPLGILYN